VNARRIGMAIFALALLSLTGCYAIDEGPERSVIRFTPFWRFAMVAVPVGALLVGAGLSCFRRTFVPGLVTMLVALVVGVLLVPGIYMDTVTITPTEIKQTTGFWFSPTVNTVRYSDVQSISIHTVKKRKGGDARRWIIHRTDGTTRELDPGDLWENNEDFVVKKLRQYGVTIQQ
jgi:hypothetical protein